MEQKHQEAVHYSPDKLLASFSGGRIIVWGLVAVAIHIVFIGVTSVGFIRDRWIDPEGAEARRKAAAEAVQAAQPKPVPKAAATAVATNVVPPKVVSVSSTGGEERLLQERKDTPVVRRITQTAGTNEIPKGPGDIGISIDDTNPR